MGKRQIWMEKKEMKGGVFNEWLPMNVFPTGCLNGQWGEGSAKCRQLQTGGRGSKIPKNVQASFMDDPIIQFLNKNFMINSVKSSLKINKNTVSIPFPNCSLILLFK